jgi:hypothetical protein
MGNVVGELLLGEISGVIFIVETLLVIIKVERCCWLMYISRGCLERLKIFYVWKMKI